MHELYLCHHSPQYPDGYLEAQAKKEAEKGKNSRDNEKENSGSKRKRSMSSKQACLQIVQISLFSLAIFVFQLIRALFLVPSNEIVFDIFRRLFKWRQT